MVDPVIDHARRIHVKKRQEGGEEEEEEIPEVEEVKGFVARLVAPTCSRCGRKVKAVDSNGMCLTCRRIYLKKIYISPSSPYRRRSRR